MNTKPQPEERAMQEQNRIAVGGSAADPPHSGHIDMVMAMLESGLFDEVIWIPSGVRADKPDAATGGHRRAMTRLAFPKAFSTEDAKVKLTLRFDDIDNGKNTPTIEWLERIRATNPKARISFFTGTDAIIPRPAELGRGSPPHGRAARASYDGRCDIAAWWVRGEELLANWPIVVYPRAGYPHPEGLSLPKNFSIVGTMPGKETSSSDIRRRIAQGQPFEHLVPPDIADYIITHHLYRREP